MRAIVNPKTGDYYDRHRQQFRCFLATHGDKGIEVGSYDANMSKEARLNASRWIWKRVFGDLK